MKSKRIIALIALLLAVCLGLSGWLLLRDRKPKKIAQIYQGAEVVKEVDLGKNQSFTLTTKDGGENTIEVKDGKIAVTHANCPDQICVLMGAQDSGIPIACLPHSLMIWFP